MRNHWDRLPPFGLRRLVGSVRAHWSARDHGTPLMTDAGAGAISSWTDRIAGITLTDGGTSGKRPTFGATALNGGFPGLTFNGSANCLEGTSFAALPTGSEPGMLWVVGQGSGGTDAVTRILVQYGSTTTGAYRRIQKSTADLFTGGDGTSNANLSTSDYPEAASTFQFVVMFRARPASYSGGTNGFHGRTPVAGTLNTGGGTLRMRVGASNLNTASSFFLGTISEVFVTSDLDENRVNKIIGAKAWEYGFQNRLVAAHPYRGHRP